MIARLHQRLRIEQTFAELLRGRHAQAIAQGMQQNFVDRPLPISGHRPHAFGQQAVDVLQYHVRHKRHSVLHMPLCRILARP